MTAVVLRGDARHLPLPDASVDLIVTSPPYFGLRSYTDGGGHYDGQIGSEATPAEWVAALVECTTEWVRVLKPSGSLFVNLGDSYAGGSSGGPPSASSTLAGNGHVGGGPKLSGLAPGNRGQRARRPVPRGEQFTREDAAWLAGVIDSDGSISIRINRQPEGNAPPFVPWVRVGQMRPEVVARIAELVGTGKVMQDGRGVWSWTAAAQQARWVLERIHPWLLIKKRQAWAAVEVARHVEDRNAKGSWRQLAADDIAYRQRLRDAVLAWNKGRPDDMPVPEPRPVALPVYPFAPQAKSLNSLPWQYALECVGRLGLILRRDVVWHKVNGLPESCTDRCRSSHEYLFHLTRQPRYYAAVDEIREDIGRSPRPVERLRASGSGNVPGHTPGRWQGTDGASTGANPLGKLPGSVWEIPSQPLSVPAHLGVDHFAAFPMELPRRCVLGWSPPGICTACGEGRRPVSVTENTLTQATNSAAKWSTAEIAAGNGRHRKPLRTASETTITGYACGCPDDSAPVRPAVVVDPFGGTGTTALVASMLGRTGVSVDLSGDYCRLALWRIRDPAERARALQVPKPPPVPSGQGSLFDDLEAS